MKLIQTVLFILIVLSAAPARSQDSTATPGEMRTYYMVTLHHGPRRDQDSATAATIQKGHLANLTNLWKLGKLAIAGPFLDDGDPVGICIMATATLEEAQALMEKDPAVIAGRLIVKVRPWYSMRGAKLP